MDHLADQASYPPGTFLLIKDEHLAGEEEHKAIVLNPTPSADPNEPLNWSTLRKAINYTLVLAVTVNVFTALSIQIIFWQQMTVDLRLTYQQLNNSVSVNFVGLAVGCLLFIPLARKFGRRPVYVVSTGIMAAMAFWTAELKSLGELYATNLFFGLAGATNEAIVQMTIADLFFVHHRGSMNGLYLSMVMTGSFLTPMAAGTQATAEGWRWSYRTLGITSAALFVLFLFFYEETKYVPVIFSRSHSSVIEDTEESNCTDSKPALRSKTVDVQSETTKHHHIDNSIPMKSWRQRLAFITYTDEPILPHFYRPLVILTTFPTVTFTGLQYAAGVVWLTIMAVVLGTVFPLPPYHFTPAQVGYMSTGPFIGNLIGSLYGGFLGDLSILFHSRRNKGVFEPEMRLYLLHLPALSMCGGIIMFGVTIARGEHWILPSIAGALFGFGLGSIGDASLTLVIDSYKEITGDAFTGIAFLRNAISIGIPFCIIPWMKQDGLQNMFIACGFISLGVSALIIPLIIYGRRIRAALAPRYRRFAAEQGVEI